MLNDPTTIRRLYGRRQGHALRPGQQRLVDERLSALAVPPTGLLDAAGLFGADRPLELEIGFGKGEHLAARAQARPELGLIGCEPFLDGVVGALTQIETAELANIRLHMGDALDVLERLPDASLERVYLLHPDPWPKARHAKRRFVNPGPVALIARKLKPGGEFRCGTDHPVYVRWTLMIMQQASEFVWLAERPSDFLKRPADWTETRYEAKARRLGHEVWHLRYRRR